MRLAAARLRAGLVSLTGTGAGVSIILAVLVMTTVFAATASPRESLAYRTRALQGVFASVPAAGRSVVATVDYFSLATALGGSGGLAPPIDAGQLRSIRAGIARRLIASGVPLQPSAARWSGLTTAELTLRNYARSVRSSTPPRVQIMYRGALSRYARIAAGTMPAHSVVASGTGGQPARVEVAVTQATATRFGLRPGSILHVGSRLELVVTGIVRAVHPGSSFWTEDPSAAAASFVSVGKSGDGYWQGSVLVTTPELAGVETLLDVSKMTITWDFPLRLGGVTADQAGPLAASLHSAAATAGIITGSDGAAAIVSPASASLVAGVASPLAQFVSTEGQVASLLSLLEVSLAIVGAVVLLLGGRLLAERRAAELAIMRARGATLGQVAGLGLQTGLVVVLPAAACGVIVAVALTPRGDEPLAWGLAGLTTLAAVAGIPWLTIRQAVASGPTSRRPDRPLSRAERSKRLVADVTLTAAAIGGLIVLRRQGLSSASADWYASAAPALVAIPLAILVVRGYPYLVRSLVRLARRRSGVTAFVGLARAARTSATSVLPVFALVLVLTVTGFGVMLRSAVDRGDVLASWRAVGADAVVDASSTGGTLGPPTQHALVAVPGVRRWCPLSVLYGKAVDGTSLDVVVIDPARYAALVAGTPLAGFPVRALTGPGNGPAAGSGAASVPVLASPSAAADLRSDGRVLVGGRSLRVRVAAVVPSPASQATGTDFVVISDRAAGLRGLRPNVVLITGPKVAGTRLRAVLSRARPGAVVDLRSRVLGSLTGAPLPHSAFVTFAQGALASAGFGAVIVLIMLALGARLRELTLARLFTMGLSPGQARWLVVAEVLPSIVAAAAGGTAAALVLVPLLAPAIDLSLFTGSSAPVAMRADVGVLLYLAAGLLGVSVLTLVAQSAATRLRGVARALRVGE